MLVTECCRVVVRVHDQQLSHYHRGICLLTTCDRGGLTLTKTYVLSGPSGIWRPETIVYRARSVCLVGCGLLARSISTHKPSLTTRGPVVEGGSRWGATYATFRSDLFSSPPLDRKTSYHCLPY